MKEWKNITYKGLNCDLVFTEKGDWGYVETSYYMLWVIANSKQTLDKIKDLGFQLFDRNTYFLRISNKEAEKIITNIKKCKISIITPLRK